MFSWLMLTQFLITGAFRPDESHHASYSKADD